MKKDVESYSEKQESPSRGIILSLKAEEVKFILGLIAERPLKEVVSLAEKIVEQYNKQQPEENDEGLEGQ